MISQFSAQVFFINFTSGLGLLALAGFLVDVIAIFVIPEKNNICSKKFSEISCRGEKIKKE